MVSSGRDGVIRCPCPSILKGNQVNNGKGCRGHTVTSRNTHSVGKKNLKTRFQNLEVRLVGFRYLSYEATVVKFFSRIDYSNNVVYSFMHS